MSQYELTFLLNEDSEVKKIKELILSLEGSIESEEKWGEKQLCYPIKGTMKAVFYHWRLVLSPERMQELRKKLNFNEKLIRFLLLAVK